MGNPAIGLKEMSPHERVRLKRRLFTEHDERTPTSGTMQLTEQGGRLPWDPTNPNQFFLNIQTLDRAGLTIGSFWGEIIPERAQARLYDFYIVPQEPFINLGTEIMGHLEIWLSRKNICQLLLELHEKASLTALLLEKVGFEQVSVTMKKTLSPVSGGTYRLPKLPEG